MLQRLETAIATATGAAHNILAAQATRFAERKRIKAAEKQRREDAERQRLTEENTRKVSARRRQTAYIATLVTVLTVVAGKMLSEREEKRAMIEAAKAEQHRITFERAAQARIEQKKEACAASGQLGSNDERERQ